ncbi:conserved hypothetical protein [Photobacterium leiognathi lrivu.4.1]|uniref:Uncharacterized protein n=2 Tax=Photobacterium leiognathi TaxID=553611 RepID=X0NMN7_PHOLE|nr:conserved hypothetical protein [Photobacterium leiognathi lrivu.4.1]
MKHIKWLGLCLVTAFQVHAKPAPVISVDIDFVSTQWIDNLGTFRVVVFNSEVNPCFTLENYKEGTSQGLTSSQQICKVALPDHQVVNLQDDPEGDMWFEDFHWGESSLDFNLNTFNANYNCSLALKNLHQVKKQNVLAQCRLVKSNNKE